MADQNQSAYIPLQLGNVDIDEKLRALSAASKAKSAELSLQLEAAQEAATQSRINEERNKNSWVSGMGLDPDGVGGSLMNLGSSAVYGVGRTAGHVLSLLPNMVANQEENRIPDNVRQAYNRFNQGKDSQEDRDLLKAMGSGPGMSKSLSNIQQLFNVEDDRAAARKINNLFDFNGIVHQGNRDALNKSLDSAKEDVTTLTDSNAAFTDRLKAFGGAAKEAGKAAVNNPLAASEYVAENLPQMIIGGKSAELLGAANAGYAMDEYSKGMENLAKDGKDIPDREQQKVRMFQAATLAAAEQVGELVQLKGVGKLFGKAEAEVAKAGLKGGFLGTLKAGAEGFLGEAATETYQTHMEQVIENRKVDNMETFKGGVIGGLAGGGMSTGGHVLGLATGAENKAEQQAIRIASAQAFKAAVETNDVSSLLDETSKQYNPALAVGALHQMNLAQNATPESRMENFNKATEVLSGLDARQAELKEQLKSDDKKVVKAARAGLEKLNLQVRDGQTVWNEMFDKMNAESTTESVDAQVEQANVPAQEASEQTVAATDNVINLSMASIKHLSPQQAEELAGNTENNLSDEQRSFLRTFSAARLAYNAAQDVPSVSNTIMNGDAKNLGISQYRTRLGMALTSNNEAKASADMKLLNAFATSHTEKAAAAQEAFDKFGEGGQVYKTQNGWGYAAPGTYSAKEINDGGGLYVIKPKLLKALNAEAKAVAAVRDEMTQAVAIKFGPVQTQNAPVQSAAPAANIPPTQKVSTQETVEEEARLSENQTAPVVEAPAQRPKKEKVVHTGKEFATAKEAEQYLYDNFIAESYKATRKADKSGYVIESRKKVAPAAKTEEKVETKPKANVLSGVDKQARIDASARGERINKPAPVAPSPESTPLTSVADAPSVQDASSAALAEEQDNTIQQDATEQPAEAVAEATAAEVVPAVEAIAEKAPEGSTYQQKKLGDFFVQADTALGRVKDFISSAKSPKELAALVGISGLTGEQSAALRSFVKAAKGWQAAITSNLVNVGTPEYNYRDAMQYFIREDGDIEENVKSAISYAVFSYIAENFGGKGYNTKGAINALLGREKDTFIDQQEHELFSEVTASMPAVIEALGQRITKALGLQATENTPVNELARLQAGLGAHALRLLTDGKNPLMTMKSVKLQTMNEIRARGKKGAVPVVGKTSANQDETFLVVNRDAERLPTDLVREILQNVQGSKGIVNELFSIESAQRPPSFKPVIKLREFAKRTEQVVPQYLNSILLKLNKQQNFLRQDKLQIAQVLGDELFLQAMGVTKVDDKVHIANRKSAEARNDGLRRELANIKEFVKSYLGDDIDQAFYFEHYSMKQQRVGISNSLVNPQLSKIHRFMVYRNSWVAEVNMQDAKSMQNFKLRTGEGFGIDPVKMSQEAALKKFDEVFSSQAVKDGIAALNKIESGESLTETEKEAIVAAVGDHAAHGLDALVGMATYSRAIDAKAETFKVNMLSEVDGVTNGPMLSHLLMGAAGSAKELFNVLNRGGFYQSEGTQMNEWRGAGNQDLYEATTNNALNNLAILINQGKIDQQALAPVMHFMGKLKDPVTGAVLKAGRNMIKTPLTAMVYGSGINTAIEGMAGDFIANIYKQIETAYSMRDIDSAAAIKMHKETVAALVSMGMKVPANTSVSEMMELQFSKAEENQLIGQFMETLGKSVDVTIRDDFKHLLDARIRFNQTASMAFDMYNSAYVGLRNQLIAELVKSGEIAATVLNNELHDLTPKQEAILDERMAKITPVLQTAMSNLSGQPAADTGMLVSDTETVPAKTLAYRNIVNFAKGFKGGTTKTLTVYARRLVNADPGVGLGATSTHSFDSAVAHTAINDASKAGQEILNLHDAGGTGINDLVEQGRRMNKAVWDRAISWSPTTEMYESYMRTVRGMEALLADKNTPKEVLELLAKSIVAQAAKFPGKNLDGSKKRQPNPASMLMARALEAKRLAAETNSVKLAAMAEMFTITQYAVEGGQYDVTEQDRAKATELLNAETTAMPEADIASVQNVNDALQDYIKAAVAEAAQTKNGVAAPITTSDIGTLGKSAVDSDIKLVNFFRAKPNRTVQEVAAFLATQNLTGFESKLLNALVKSLGARTASYSVNFLTKTSELKDVLEPATGPSHAWFVSKDGQNAIYLLSPDFKESGLTKETLLHEMVHAAVAHAIANPTAETRPLIDELEKIREQASVVVRDSKLTHLEAAVSSVQELVAYGMTNPEFQAILDSFAFNSTTKDNKWVSGLWAFIDTLVNLVVGRKNDSMATGMTSLFTNVSGLMAASAKSQASTANINQSMTAPATPTLAALRGEEMYDALGALGTTTLEPGFDNQLRNVLDLMEQSVHSPLAALKEAALANAAQTPVEMWESMKAQGLVEFAQGALASGFHFTEQEAFAQQQVEATVRTALTNKDGSTTAVYRELARLYNEVRENMKGRVAEFHPNANQAQALYDFVFKMQPGLGNMSDYLSRFAALGLTNQQFSELLNFRTEVTERSLDGLTFGEKLHAIFERVLSFINAKATNTFGGQKADEKLMSLVNQLVDIEQKKRMKIAQSAGVAMDTFEKIFRDGFTAARKGAEAVAASDFFRKNSNGAVRMAGRVASVVAGERVEEYLNGLQTFRDATMRDRLGIMMGLVNETRGAHAMNVMYHKLLRLTKHTEGVRKEIITNTANFVLDSFKDGGKYLTAKMKESLSYGVLRTDMAALLDHFSMAEMQKLFESPAALAKAITDFEGKLAGFDHAKAYQNGAKALGLYLATNEVGAENLRLNADNIANMLGTEQANKVVESVAVEAAAVIDPLASLYALRMLDQNHRTRVAQVFAEEAARTDQGHGIEMLMKMHQDLQKQSKERLFQGTGTLRMKGYTPEIYNPYIRVDVAANAQESTALQERGYNPGHILQMDSADPDVNDTTRIHALRDGGMVQYLTGIFSYTGQNRRGSSTHNGDMGLLSEGGKMNRAKMDNIARGQQKGVRNQSVNDIDPQGAAKRKNYLVPVFNASGEVVNYRYMMNAATKDSLLERTNDFDQLMGVMAGSIYDKETTVKQNETAVQALYDQYKEDFGRNAGSYLEVGPNSKDAEAREVWRLLPQSTKDSVKEIFGKNAMMVRYDLLDMNFGYRKRSAATPFGIPEDQRNNFQQAYVQLLEGMLGKKAGLYVRQTEEAWQALVREAKDTMVVKSGMTLLGNFTSNISELIWFGVPLTDIWHHHRVALKGITAYRKDSKRLDALEQAVRLNQLSGRDRGEIDREIVQLKDSLARNPVRELVEAGMMPTIVEDVSQDEDKYSYKGKLVGAVDDFVGNLNPHVLKVGKVLAMAHDTPLYKALSYGTQVSDFVARYTLYQHVINRAKNPIEGDKALQLVSDAFVNYDVPSHRDVQYANDMGLVYFTKYYLRIQKVIALLYRENPGRAMMLLTLGHFMDFLPMLTHSQMLERVGNPFSIGAFEALGSLDEMLTIQTLMTPFR